MSNGNDIFYESIAQEEVQEDLNDDGEDEIPVDTNTEKPNDGSTNIQEHTPAVDLDEAESFADDEVEGDNEAEEDARLPVSFCPSLLLLLLKLH